MRDPNRRFELDVLSSMRQIIETDAYFITSFANKRTSVFKVFRDTLLIRTIDAYPAMAIYIDKVEYYLQNGFYKPKPKVLIEVACQASELEDARELSILFQKDIRYTFNMTDLSSFVNSNLVRVNSCIITDIEASAYAPINRQWTFISTMQLEITIF